MYIVPRKLMYNEFKTNSSLPQTRCASAGSDFIYFDGRPLDAAERHRNPQNLSSLQKQTFEISFSVNNRRLLRVFLVMSF